MSNVEYADAILDILEVSAGFVPSIWPALEKGILINCKRGLCRASQEPLKEIFNLLDLSQTNFPFVFL